MRRSIKIIAIIITAVIFGALNGVMFLVDFTTESDSTWALVVLIGFVAAILAVGVFLFIRNRGKSKFKM